MKLAVLLALCAACAVAPLPPDYNYDENDAVSGPDGWAALSLLYAECDPVEFPLQSPVNLVAHRFATGGEFETHLANDRVQHGLFSNDGKQLTVAVDGNAGATHAAGVLTGYELQWIELHVPSEHRLNGRQYPLEVQFYHRHQFTGELAAMAVLYTFGAKNHGLEALLQRVPAEGEHVSVLNFRPRELLHGSYFGDYFVYYGGLTHPPCTQGVRWLVSKRPAPMARHQLPPILQAGAVFAGGNNRPYFNRTCPETEAPGLPSACITMVNLEGSVNSWSSTSEALTYTTTSSTEETSSSASSLPSKSDSDGDSDGFSGRVVPLYTDPPETPVGGTTTPLATEEVPDPYHHQRPRPVPRDPQDWLGFQYADGHQHRGGAGPAGGYGHAGAASAASSSSTSSDNAYSSSVSSRHLYKAPTIAVAGGGGGGDYHHEPAHQRPQHPLRTSSSSSSSYHRNYEYKPAYHKK